MYLSKSRPRFENSAFMVDAMRSPPTAPPRAIATGEIVGAGTGAGSAIVLVWSTEDKGGAMELDPGELENDPITRAGYGVDIEGGAIGGVSGGVSCGINPVVNGLDCWVGSPDTG